MPKGIPLNMEKGTPPRHLVELLETLDDPQFTVKEVACLLALHPETIRRWCRQGKIACFQVGPWGAYRIPASSIDMTMRKRILPGTPMIHRLKYYKD